MNIDEHLLVTLIEECNEVAYHASKALRFGTDDIAPGSLDRATEAEKIHVELSHVFSIASLLHERRVIPGDLLDGKIITLKKARFWEFMDYSLKKGTFRDETMKGGE